MNYFEKRVEELEAEIETDLCNNCWMWEKAKKQTAQEICDMLFIDKSAIKERYGL